jgi:hypothetical protein
MKKITNKILLISLILNIEALYCQEVKWSTANVNLYPNKIKLQIAKEHEKNPEKTYLAEFDLINERIVIFDSTVVFKVEEITSLGQFYIVYKQSGQIIKTTLISRPFSNNVDLQKYHRIANYDKFELNEVRMALENGIIYTWEDEFHDIEKYKNKIVEGKILSIDTNSITILDKNGEINNFSKFQIGALSINESQFKNLKLAYEAIFNKYEGFILNKVEEFTNQLKGKSIEEVIEKLGAYKSVFNINGNHYITWIYESERYSLSASIKTESEQTELSGNLANSTLSFGLPNSEVYISNSISNVFAASIFKSNRQYFIGENYQSISRAKTSMKGEISGEIIRTKEEASITIKFNTENKAIGINQSDLIKAPIYGNRFFFY